MVAKLPFVALIAASAPASPGGRTWRTPAPEVGLPCQTVPRSLKAAWLILRQHDLEWQALRPDIKTAESRIIERFMTTPVVEGEPLAFGEVAVEHLRRKHVKAL